MQTIYDLRNSRKGPRQHCYTLVNQIGINAVDEDLSTRRSDITHVERIYREGYSIKEVAWVMDIRPGSRGHSKTGEGHLAKDVYPHIMNLDI